MKKITIILFSTSVLVIILLFIISNNKKVDLKFYSLFEAQGLVMDDDRELTFDIYSTRKDSVICNLDSNEYFLELDDMTIKLIDININEIQIDKEMYLIKISSPIPKIGMDEYISYKQNLIIKNSLYTLKLKYGPISFLNPDKYNLLSLDTLYASYMKTSKGLEMVGLNIMLHNDYDYLKSIRLGPITYATLSKSQKDTLHENIIDMPSFGYNYNPTRVEKEYLMSLDTKTYFIPLGYIDNCILRKTYMIFEIDLETYYFDTFSFMTNNLDIKEYEGFKIEGELIYA